MTRDALIDKLNLAGIETKPVFYPLHEMPPYTDMGESRRSR